MATAKGTVPTPTVATTVLLAVSITETVLEPDIRHIGAGSVRGDGHPIGGGPNPDRGNHGVARRVDHRDGVGVRFVT